jgi:hypothetical protein
MKLPLLAGVALACLLSGCGSLSGGSNAELMTTLKAIATDTNCGHTDRVNVILGPMPTGSLLLERTCPPVPPADPSAIPK